MFEIDEEQDVEIKVFKYKELNRVEVEICYGYEDRQLEIVFSDLYSANNFIKALKKAPVSRFKVDEDGNVFDSSGNCISN